MKEVQAKPIDWSKFKIKGKIGFLHALRLARSFLGPKGCVGFNHKAGKCAVAVPHKIKGGDKIMLILGEGDTFADALLQAWESRKSETNDSDREFIERVRKEILEEK